MNWTFLPASAKDVDELHRLDRICFDAPFAFSRATFAQLLSRIDTISVAARTDEARLAGFIIIEQTMPDAACVATIDVSPDFRRMGLGRSLMERGLRIAGLRGLFKSYLHVYVDNRNAIAFYKGLGYGIVKRLPAFYGKGYDACLMLLDSRTRLDFSE